VEAGVVGSGQALHFEVGSKAGRFFGSTSFFCAGASKLQQSAAETQQQLAHMALTNMHLLRASILFLRKAR